MTASWRRGDIQGFAAYSPHESVTLYHSAPVTSRLRMMCCATAAAHRVLRLGRRRHEDHGQVPGPALVLSRKENYRGGYPGPL